MLYISGKCQGILFFYFTKSQERDFFQNIREFHRSSHKCNKRQLFSSLSLLQIIDIVDKSLHCTNSEELYKNLVSIPSPF